MSEGPVFRLRSVSVEGRLRPRLADVDLELRSGTVAVLGDSGAGKTTLLEVLVGFTSPDRGRVERPAVEPGLVPYYWVPSSGGLWPQRTVLEHVRGVAPRGGEARANELLERLGLGAVSSQRPANLSDGQRARLSLARALATGAPALFVDEALAHVDRLHRPVALELLAEVGARGGLLVLTTHDGGEARSLADRCVVLSEGRVAFDGSTRTLDEHPPSEALARLLRVCLLLAAFLFTRCTGEEHPPLEFSGVRSVSLPPEGPKTPAPRGLARTRDGSLLVLDTIGRVLRFDAEGRYVTHWWMPEHEVGRPEGVVELADGRIAVADTHYHRVVFFDAEGRVLSTIGEEGTGPGEFLYPVKLIEDPSGVLYVAEYGSNDRVQRFSSDGRFLGAFGSCGTEPGQFQRTAGLAWHEGRIYVADAVNHRIQVFTDEGQFLEVLGGAEPVALSFPYDLCLDDEGHLVTVEYDACRVTVLGLDGTWIGSFGRAGRDLGQFDTPWGVRAMAGGRIWVADTGNRRLVELSP